MKQPQAGPVVTAGAWSLFPRPESPIRDPPPARGGERAQVKEIDGGHQGSTLATKTPAAIPSRTSESRSALSRDPSTPKVSRRGMVSAGSGKAKTGAATAMAAAIANAEKRDADSGTKKTGDLKPSITKKAGKQDESALPARSTAVVREALSHSAERKTRQSERNCPPATDDKAVKVGISKSRLPKSSPEKAEAAKSSSSNTSSSKAAQSEAPQATIRNSKAVGAATSTTRGREGKGKLAAFVSSVAGGVAATSFFLYRTGIARSALSPQEQSSSWNPFNDLHATGRHPSWSSQRSDNDRSSSSDAKKDEARTSSVSAEENKAASKQGAIDSTGQEDAKGRGTSADGAEKGKIEREWPVFGSGGVGGKFGAF